MTTIQFVTPNRISLLQLKKDYEFYYLQTQKQLEWEIKKLHYKAKPKGLFFLQKSGSSYNRCEHDFIIILFLKPNNRLEMND